MKKENINLIKWMAIGLVLLYLFYVLFFFIENYVHESGHVLFGFIGSLFNGKVSSYAISSWMNYPYIPFIQFPQQTKLLTGIGTGGFAIGGPLLIILVAFFISVLLYNRGRKKEAFILFLVFFLNEIVGNFVCGTDNPQLSPYSVCNTLGVSIIGFFLFLMAVLFAFLMLYITITSKLFKNKIFRNYK